MTDELDQGADAAEPEASPGDVLDQQFPDEPTPEVEAAEEDDHQPEATPQGAPTPDGETGSLPVGTSAEPSKEGGAEPSAPTIEDELGKLRAEHAELKTKYDGREKSYSQEHRTRLDVERQLQEYRSLGGEPAQLRQRLDDWQKYQQRVVQKAPWDPQHPAYGNFMGLVSRARESGVRIQELYRDANMPEDVRARLVASEEGRFSQEEKTLLDQFNRANQEVRDNPIGYVSRILESREAHVSDLVRNTIERVLQEKQAQMEVRNFATQHPDLISKHGQTMRDVLEAPQSGRLYDVATRMAQLEAEKDALAAENATLKGKLGTAAEKAVQADAQMQTQRNRAVKIPGRSGGKTPGVNIQDLRNMDRQSIKNGDLLDALLTARNGAP